MKTFPSCGPPPLRQTLPGRVQLSSGPGVVEMSEAPHNRGPDTTSPLFLLAWVQSGALSLVESCPDTVLSLVELYYAGLCHNNTPQGKSNASY